MSALAPVRTFPPVVTASKWSTAWQTLWNGARARRGERNASDGTISPVVTNAEALTLAMAWKSAASGWDGVGFPLWYQFAAVAYGWTPKRDTLNGSAARGAKSYPTDAANELWLSTSSLARELDDSGAPNPRLDLATRWGDPTLQAAVQAELRADGARAAFEIPTGACRDKATGKTRARELECVSPSGRRVAPRFVNGIPYCPRGYEMKAVCPTGTDPITYRDPLSALLDAAFNILAPVALIVTAVGLLGNENKRR